MILKKTERRSNEECLSLINAFDLKHFFFLSPAVARFQIYVFILNTVPPKKKKTSQTKNLRLTKLIFKNILCFFFWLAVILIEHHGTNTQCTIRLSKPSLLVAYSLARGATSPHIICFIDYEDKSNIELQHTRRACVCIHPALAIVQSEWKIHAFFCI